MGEMATRGAPPPPVRGGGQTASRGRRCGAGGWLSRRWRASAVVAAALAAVTVVVACLAAATRGSPTASLVGSDDGDGAAAAPLVAFPSRRSLLPALDGLASRAAEFGSGPCSTSTCIARWKGGFIAILFVEGLFGGVAPQALHFLSPLWRTRSLHIANAFGGGIFFTTGMLHILPEAVAHLAGEGHGAEAHDEEHEEEEGAEGEEHHDEEEGEHDEETHGFPTAYALVVAGFYAILFIEHLMLGKYAHSHGAAAAAARAHGAAKGQPSLPPLESAVHPGGEVAETATDGVALGVKTSEADYTTMLEDDDGPVEAEAPRGGTLLCSSSNASAASVRTAGSAGTDLLDEDSAHGAMLAAENVGFFSPNFGRALLAAVSVAIHSVFESLSLGLASSWPALFNTFLAIAAHKWATAASLGVKFEKERLRRWQSAALVLGWAAVTPASAGIGAAINGGVSDEVTGVLLALSAGTFLYIGVFEVTSEEFVERNLDRWPKAAAMALGAGVIMAVTAILSSTGVH